MCIFLDLSFGGIPESSFPIFLCLKGSSNLQQLKLLCKEVVQIERPQNHLFRIDYTLGGVRKNDI